MGKLGFFFLSQNYSLHWRLCYITFGLLSTMMASVFVRIYSNPVLFYTLKLADRHQNTKHLLSEFSLDLRETRNWMFESGCYIVIEHIYITWLAPGTAVFQRILVYLGGKRSPVFSIAVPHYPILHRFLQILGIIWWYFGHQMVKSTNSLLFCVEKHCKNVSQSIFSWTYKPFPHSCLWGPFWEAPFIFCQDTVSPVIIYNSTLLFSFDFNMNKSPWH